MADSSYQAPSAPPAENPSASSQDIDPVPRTILALVGPNQSFVTRLGIVAVIVLFLLFTYYLIGGYTSKCACGSGEPYRNCSCGRSRQPFVDSHSHQHAHSSNMNMGHPHAHSGSSNIYQAGPHLNF
jgi:hypothetical protein